MRHVLGMLFAIGVAGVAAIAATTAMLNTPLRIGPQPATTQASPPPASAPTGESKPATSDTGKPAAPAGTPDTATPSKTPAGGTSAATGKDDEGDKDPYEGIAPEELPPDLQYSADSSVSFPTNI